jgi:hypothetical protein
LTSATGLRANAALPQRCSGQNDAADRSRPFDTGACRLRRLASLDLGRAAALEVTWIEASKYKHLYKIFGGDARRFAAYLQIDPGRLPGPEHCRAALVSGKVEPPAAQDAAKLADIIVQNEGWLATLHLSSTGGSVGSG